MPASRAEQMDPSGASATMSGVAGTIFLSTDSLDGDAWSAAGWLFDFVITRLAGAVEDERLAARLAEIVDEHSGALAFADLGRAEQIETLSCLGAAR